MAVKSNFKKALFVVYFILIQICAAIFIYEKIAGYYFPPLENVKTEKVEPLAAPSELQTPANYSRPNAEAAENKAVNAVIVNEDSTNSPQTDSDKLMIPVAGIKKEKLLDTFNDARSEGRVHNAIDIPAPLGTPVVAAIDGEIVKFFESKNGGITIYQFNGKTRKIYYYAHLQKRADNLKENDFVRQGTIIGYVGDTGNAGAGNYHLHFSIVDQPDPKKYWQGTEENPYPQLKNGVEAISK